ncbi:MAG: hypothetical protein OXF07_12635 [Rhodobacter sp.]|nr:hypothetical protein [Rhodobacter sp.]MCY4168872.1 hypothetical protein [Rhodobacter sp.]MCY4240230.1 hypothetical protein [Rhodobacter sp.]
MAPVYIAKDLTDEEREALAELDAMEIGTPVKPSPELLAKINSQQELNDVDIEREVAKKKAAALAEKARSTG